MANGSRSPSPERGRRYSRTPDSNRDRSKQLSPAPDSPSRTRENGSRRRSHDSRRSQSFSRSPVHRSPPHRGSEPVRSTKIVVERLTKNVNVEHLREIFGAYGPIRDLDMPLHRQFMTSRGTAYILYESEADAEAAIASMHEAQVDGAIINVSIVLPRRKFSPPPPTARRGANIDPRGPPPGYRGPAVGRRRSPQRGFGRLDRPSADVYRPRSVSRSRSPPRRRSRSPSYGSRSPSPRRRARDSPRGHGRRRSPSYSSYSSYDRSRSRSRDRGGRR